MRKYLFLFSSLFLLSAGACTVIFFNVDPENASNAVLSAFFFFLFIFLFSLFCCMNTIILPSKKNTNVLAIVRRSALISSVIVGLLILSSFSVLNVVSGVSFVIAIALVELYFSSQEKMKGKG